MASIISTFHIDWKIIIAQIINFGVVFVVLYIFALKPLAKLMAERSEKIGRGIKDADTNAKLLSETRTEYEAALVQARNEANKIFQEGKKEAQIKKQQMMEEAKKEVAKIIANGKTALETEKIKMVADAKKEVATLIVEVTEKLLSEKVDSSYTAKVTKELAKVK